MKIILLNDCVNSKKYGCKINQKEYFCYIYNGNYHQNFVVDAHGNDITTTKLGLRIQLAVMNYDLKR